MTFAVENNRAKLTRVTVDDNNGDFVEVRTASSKVSGSSFIPKTQSMMAPL
jgi:hypothetical protein